jgi:hypothetical protein
VRVLFLPALLISFPYVGTLRAQPANAPRLGQTVRVWAAQPLLSKQVGRIVAPQGDTLHLRRRVLAAGSPPVWDTLRVAWSSVQRLEARRVSHVRGAFKGFLWGVGTGLLAGFGIVKALEHREEAMFAVPFMTLFGMSVGTVLGTVIGSESWRRVYP